MNNKALILHPKIKFEKNRRSDQNRIEEANSLAKAIELDVFDKIIISISNIKPNNFFGLGKLEEIEDIVKDNEINIVIVNNSLSPIQQRNLEKILNTKVIDRTALILEIFGKRANTKEGKLQVELAALEYQKSRLVRSWTHLERQKGGAGFMGGPGERQIELDRRIINDKITSLKKDLSKVVKTRELHRKSRKKVPYPIIALVGYTNAGKSTLFNHLTGADVMAQDMLFATLDPTMRAIKLPSKKQVILSDTVGFVSELPTELIASFRATLEEVIYADIILHIRDISSPETKEQKLDVVKILKDIGIDEDKLIEVYNKIDLINIEHNAIAISAINGTGVKKLLDAVDKKLSEDEIEIKISTDISNGKEISWIYKNSNVLNKKVEDMNIYFEIKISKEKLSMLKQIKKINL